MKENVKDLIVKSIVESKDLIVKSAILDDFYVDAEEEERTGKEFEVGIYSFVIKNCVRIISKGELNEDDKTFIDAIPSIDFLMGYSDKTVLLCFEDAINTLINSDELMDVRVIPYQEEFIFWAAVSFFAKNNKDPFDEKKLKAKEKKELKQIYHDLSSHDYKNYKKAEKIRLEIIEYIIELNESPYLKILQGKGTNAIAHTSKKNMAIDSEGKGTVKTGEVEIFLDSYNRLDLGVPTNKVLDILTTELTKKIPSGSKSTLEQIDKNRGFYYTLKDYQKSCGIKDIKHAREQLNKAIRSLYGVSIKFDEVHKSKNGKDKIIHHQMRILDHIGIDEENKNPVRNGKVYIQFTMDVAKYLSKSYIMPYSKKLWGINSQKNPHSYHIGRKFLEHHNMNIGKSNDCILSVKALIDALPDLPRYEEVESTDRHFTSRIIDPFERDLEALKEKYNVIERWEYCNSKGEALTKEQLNNYDFNTWKDLFISFELLEYPDQSERLKKRNKKKNTK